ncbi:MAG: ketose-bisphosphate aldolase [Oscillospiraceae bacterium]|jgi:fructose-bisphosphate aldolase class II|nr:ketose-bisphosphate aldolase [Oscillospiraceae bacterium]
MFERAYLGKYAIGAFNVSNMEIVQGIAQAALKTNSPIIFQVSPGAIKYAGLKFLVVLVKTAIKESGIEAALHLDHGDSLKLCKECVDAGFTSVMIDGSSLSFEDNVELTKCVVDYASFKGVSVEGELGRLCGAEEHIGGHDSSYTDPVQAKEFIKRTKVNSLAVAIGTSHGINKFGLETEPSLRFDILEEISRLCTGLPIVLHGSSSIMEKEVSEISKYGVNLKKARGIPEHILRKAASSAVCKINIDSDLRLAMTLSIKKFMHENPNNFDPRFYFKAARESVTDLVKQKIVNIFKSENRNNYN